MPDNTNQNLANDIAEKTGCAEAITDPVAAAAYVESLGGTGFGRHLHQNKQATFLLKPS